MLYTNYRMIRGRWTMLRLKLFRPKCLVRRMKGRRVRRARLSKVMLGFDCIAIMTCMNTMMSIAMGNMGMFRGFICIPIRSGIE